MSGCPVTGADHCPHWQEDGSVPCCYCSPDLDLEPELSDEAGEAVERAARAEARRLGCTCEPEIELKPLARAYGASVVATLIQHDDDCPLEIRLRRAANARNN